MSGQRTQSLITILITYIICVWIYHMVLKKYIVRDMLPSTVSYMGCAVSGSSRIYMTRNARWLLLDGILLGFTWTQIDHLAHTEISSVGTIIIIYTNFLYLWTMRGIVMRDWIFNAQYCAAFDQKMRTFPNRKYVYFLLRY